MKNRSKKFRPSPTLYYLGELNSGLSIHFAPGERFGLCPTPFLGVKTRFSGFLKFFKKLFRDTQLLKTSNPFSFLSYSHQTIQAFKLKVVKFPSFRQVAFEL